MRGLLLFGLLLVASSQLVAAAGERGGDVSTDRATYTYAPEELFDGVRITFANTGNEELFLARTAPFRILDAEGNSVFTPGGLQMFLPVPPGHVWEETWDYARDCSVVVSLHPCAGIATPGSYMVEWTFYDYVTPRPLVATASFEVAVK